ncbi:MAG: hypothetical protein M3R17_05685 [Bacteroidota bacterium]|nr:hypothetical protein [Bacteroidota bacterium]
MVASLELTGLVASLELTGWVASLEIAGLVAALELTGWATSSLENLVSWCLCGDIPFAGLFCHKGTETLRKKSIVIRN